MRNWIGIVSLVIAGGFLVAAHLHKTRLVAARGRALAQGLVDGPPPDLRSISTFGDIVRPIVLFFLGYIALKLSFAFLVFDGGTVFSHLDLGGVLALLATYGVWFSTRLKYRQADIDRMEPAAPAEETPAVAAPGMVPDGAEAPERQPPVPA